MGIPTVWRLSRGRTLVASGHRSPAREPRASTGGEVAGSLSRRVPDDLPGKRGVGVRLHAKGEAERPAEYVRRRENHVKSQGDRCGADVETQVQVHEGAQRGAGEGAAAAGATVRNVGPAGSAHATRSRRMRASQDRHGDGAGDPRWWTVPRRGGRPERHSEWRRGRGRGEGRGDRCASRVLAGGDGKEVLRAAEGFFYDVGRDLNIFSR